MVPGHYKKRQGQTINIPTDQNLATLNYPSRIQDHTNANPNRSLFHSKMSEKYSRNRSVRTTGPLIPGPIRMDPNSFPVRCSGIIRNIRKKFQVLTILCHFRFAVIFEWSRDVLPVLCSAGIGGIVTNTSSAVLECSKIFLFSPPASCIFLIRRHKQKIIHTLNMV